MYFTFSKESSFGVDATSQDYTIDLLSEEIITNVNYEKFREFNSPTPKSRYPKIKTTNGRISLEFTYGNEGWNVLFECLMGKRLRIDGYAFGKSSEAWNIITGMLASDVGTGDTSFNIIEYKAGEFDNIDGIIIGNEYIAIGNISNGAVTASTRASEGSTAASHNQYDLVYGIVANPANSIDIISRYRDGYCYRLPESLTLMINRNETYFKFNGSIFSDYVFNAAPSGNTITSSFGVSSINTDILTLSSYSSSVDDNPLIRYNDINCYCMNEHLDIEKLYFQVSNTIRMGSGKILDSTYGSILLSSFSAYGQFTLIEENTDAFKEYLADTMKNVSITMCESRQFNRAYVFAFNNVRYGTMLHVLRGNRSITDSVPYFSYGPDTFFILIQN